MAVGDAQIGRNVALHRGVMSQAQLAERMRELGWKWNQGTVSAIENGERPLRLGEGADLAEILGESRFDDATMFLEADEDARILHLAAAARRDQESLAIFLDRYLRDFRDLEAALTDRPVPDQYAGMVDKVRAAHAALEQGGLKAWPVVPDGAEGGERGEHSAPPER